MGLGGQQGLWAFRGSPQALPAVDAVPGSRGEARLAVVAVDFEGSLRSLLAAFHRYHGIESRLGYVSQYGRPGWTASHVWLCGFSGVALSLAGLAFFLAFFGYPAPNSEAGIPTGPVGYYFVAFTGCALIAWGEP